MRGRHERHANLFALEPGETCHTGAVARHQRFCIVDVVENPEQRNIDALRKTCCDRAGTGLTELHRTRGQRADHLCAAAKLTVDNLVPGLLLHFAGGLRVAPWHDHVLIGDHNFFGVGVGGARKGSGHGKQRHERGERAEESVHREAPF